MTLKKLPPFWDKLLSALGFNTNRLMWKLHYWQEERNKRQAIREQQRHHRRYVHCRHCGELALAEDKVCKCGRKLPSYTAYRISRALAVDTPNTTVVSMGFIVLILLLFAAQILFDGPRALMSPSRLATLSFGAWNGRLVAEGGQYWRLMAAGLAHFGVIHILFNTMAISQMAPRFEQEIGPWRTLVLLTGSQIGTGLFFLLFSHPDRLVAGASGVAFGLIGFGLTYAWRMGRREEQTFFTHWLIYGLAFTFLVPGISIAGHLGGLAAGAPMGALMAGREPRARGRAVYRALGVCCLLLWLVCLGMLVRSVGEGVRLRAEMEAQAALGDVAGVGPPPLVGFEAIRLAGETDALPTGPAGAPGPHQSQVSEHRPAGAPVPHQSPTLPTGPARAPVPHQLVPHAPAPHRT